MGAGGPSGGSGTGPQELGFTTRDKRTDKQKQKDANVEMGLGNDRMSNYSTNEGGTREGGGGQDNNNSNITQATKKKSPTVKTTVETKVEKAADLTAEQIALRNKKRGRSSSIMTSSQGVGKTSSNYELGKTSLLGRV